MKIKLFILLFAAMCMFITVNREANWNGNFFAWDKSGYHLYLPALLIYNNVTTLSFYPELDKNYNISPGVEWYGLYKLPNGNRINKYAIGVSCLELPFFLIAHAYCIIDKRFPADGYSLPYQWGSAISTIFWVVLGLFALSAFLKSYFSDNTILLTLLCIATATNLYLYTAFDHATSHPYSFFLFCSVLYFTARWYRNLRLKDMCMIGICLGLVVITRPVNIVIAVIPLLWQVSSLQSLKERMRLLYAKRAILIIGVLFFVVIAFLQLSYWKYVTGHWIFYSYVGEQFNFLRPRIWDGIFSYRKGWAIYTPLIMICFLGWFSLWKKDNRFLLPLCLCYLLMIYITFSWCCWWYGGSFGCRPLIESYAIAAMPLAALFENMLYKWAIYKKILLSGICIFLIMLNVFQTYQFSISVLKTDRMTRAYYWHTFGKLKVSAEGERLLMTDKEYDEENINSKK